jgi:hypothetical protein
MPASVNQLLQIDGCPPVKLERRAGQRNLRIRVKPDLVVVSGPRYCTNTELISFLNDRLGWVQKTTQKLQHSRSSIDIIMHEFRGHVYLRGAWLPLVLRHARPGSDTWLLSDRQTRVDVYPPEGCTEAGFEPGSEVYAAHSSNTASEDNTAAGAEAPTEACSSKLKILTERRTLIEVPVDELLNFQRELAKKQLTNEFKELSATLPFSGTDCSSAHKKRSGARARLKKYILELAAHQMPRAHQALHHDSRTMPYRSPEPQPGLLDAGPPPLPRCETSA